MILAPFWCKRRDLIVEIFLNCYQPFPVWCWFSKRMRGSDTFLHACDQKRHIVFSPVEHLEEKQFSVFLQKWPWFYSCFRGVLYYFLVKLFLYYCSFSVFVYVLEWFYKQLNIPIDNHIRNNAINVFKSCFGFILIVIIGLSHFALI